MARWQLGQALFAEGDYQGAAKQLEKLLLLDAAHEAGRRLLARALELIGQVPAALRALEESLVRRPDDLAVRDELVGLLLAIGRFDDALLHAEEAARRAPTDPRRLVTIAELFRQKHLLSQARAQLERAQAMAPESREIADKLRELYLDLGDEAAWERVAGPRDRDYFLTQTHKTLDSSSVRALVAAGGLDAVAERMRAGDFGGARRALVSVGEEARASAAYELLRGELLLLEGDPERAERSFCACVERAADLGVAWNRLGDLAQGRGALREAVGLYKKAILFGPDDANSYEDLGDVLATLGERVEARRMYDAASRRDPEGRAAAKRATLDDPPAIASPATEAAEIASRVGKIGVLGWTPVGGGLSPLEAVAVVGRGDLHFSGNVGPLGQEAGRVALSCLKSRAKELGIEALVATHDLHLHFTDSEFGKDGLSAGLALALAGLSAYRRQPLPGQLAATGEITIHGEVKPVGGIREKLVAAHLGGVRTVILPRQNLREGRELPVELKSRITLLYVATVEEAIDRAWGGK